MPCSFRTRTRSEFLRTMLTGLTTTGRRCDSSHVTSFTIPSATIASTCLSRVAAKDRAAGWFLSDDPISFVELKLLHFNLSIVPGVADGSHPPSKVESIVDI